MTTRKCVGLVHWALIIYSARLFIGFWIVRQFFNGFASLGVNTTQTGGVAYFAHIGGFLLVLLGRFAPRLA